MINGGLQKYLFGQVLSLILATTILLNTFLNNLKNINIPATQAAFTYTVLLAGVLLYRFVRSKPLPHGILIQNSKVLIGAVFFDVAANWLIVKSFEVLKSPEIIVYSGLSTPASILMAMTWVKPRPRYSFFQLIGLLIALSAILVYFFKSSHDRSDGQIFSFDTPLSERYFYILCTVASAISYAASNNFQECASKHMASSEFLLGLGSLGSLSSWLIVAVFGREEIHLIVSQADILIFLCIFLYALVLCSFYLLIPVFLHRYSAVSFNLSLLTSNFFFLLGNWIFFGETSNIWLFVSILLINVGLLVYHVSEESLSQPGAIVENVYDADVDKDQVNKV